MAAGDKWTTVSEAQGISGKRRCELLSSKLYLYGGDVYTIAIYKINIRSLLLKVLHVDVKLDSNKPFSIFKIQFEREGD